MRPGPAPAHLPLATPRPPETCCPPPAEAAPAPPQDADPAEQLAALPVDDLLARFRREADPETLELLAEMLREREGVGPELLALLADPDENRRLAAALALGGTRDAVAPLVRVAREDASEDVRMAAMDSLHELAAHDDLLAIAEYAVEETIRIHALEGVDLSAVSRVDPVLRLAESDASADVRMAAVEALGSAGPAHRAAALPALESAWTREADPELRSSILNSIASLGRADAIAVLERLIEGDPQLARDRDDFVAILRSGESDWERILEQKARREMAR